MHATTIQLESLSKRFGATQAVADASLTIRPGEVLALLGENGAGKSTLMQLLYGVHQPDSGRILVDGGPLRMASPQVALAQGIGMVFQRFSLIPALSVRENLALALGDAPWWIGRRARRLARLDAHLATLLPELDASTPVAGLPVGQMQLVELAKVTLRATRCVILDEPSAVLAPAEAQRLWQRVRALVARGLAVVLITHKLADVHACADRVAVLRAGRVVAETAARGMVDADIVGWMVGRAPQRTAATPLPAPGAAVRLEVRGLQAGNVRALDLQVRAGEIVGIAGVSGNGQTALAQALAGVLPLRAGEVILDGELLRAPRMDAAASSSARLAYIPEQPLLNAVAPDLPLAVNLALRRIGTLPWWAPHAELRAQAGALLKTFDVRPPEPALLAGTLSGGNLQKLVAARELSGAPAAVLACYPTMGLDLVATAAVYTRLFALAQAGAAVVWISEDLDDLLQYAHRIAVMAHGRIVVVLDAARATPAEVGAWMTAGGDAASAPLLRSDVDAAQVVA